MSLIKERKVENIELFYLISKVNLFLITRQIRTIFYIYQKKLQHF